MMYHAKELKKGETGNAEKLEMPGAGDTEREMDDEDDREHGVHSNASFSSTDDDAVLGRVTSAESSKSSPKSDHPRTVTVQRSSSPIRRHATGSSQCSEQGRGVPRHTSTGKSRKSSAAGGGTHHSAATSGTTVVVNMPNCKYESVEACVLNKGWKIIRDENSTSWNLYWTDTSVSTERLIRVEKHQKLNHFPGMLKVCRKTPLARILKKMSRLFPQDYKFCPKSWVLPEEWSDFKSQFGLRIGNDGRPKRPKKNRTYIIKPDAGCQGKGISLVRDINGVNQFESSVAQKYVSRPFLVDGKKFDLRLYVLVTSVAPLRVFLFQDGLVRFCTEPYTAPKRSNLKKTKMHLTNYAINKVSKQGNEDDDEDAEDDACRPDRGVKRSVVWLREWLSEQGYDSHEVWKRIADMTVKLLLPSVPELCHTYLSAIGSSRRSNVGGEQGDSNGIAPSEDVAANTAGLWTRVGGAPIRNGIGIGVNSQSNFKHKTMEVKSSCFEILGVDILLDHKLDPWVIEVNHSPSFTTDSPLDRAIKTRLIRETLALLKLRASDQRNVQQKASAAAKTRLYSGRAPTNPRSATLANNMTEDYGPKNETAVQEGRETLHSRSPDASPEATSAELSADQDSSSSPREIWETDPYVSAEKRQRVCEALAAPGFSRIYPPHDKLDEIVSEETDSKVRANSLKAQKDEETSKHCISTGNTVFLGKVAGFPHVYANGGRERCPGMTTTVVLNPAERRYKWAQYCKLLVAAADIFDRGTGRSTTSTVRGAGGLTDHGTLASKLSAIDEAFRTGNTSSSNLTTQSSDDQDKDEDDDDDDDDSQENDGESPSVYYSDAASGEESPGIVSSSRLSDQETVSSRSTSPHWMTRKTGSGHAIRHNRRPATSQSYLPNDTDVDSQSARMAAGKTSSPLGRSPSTGGIVERYRRLLRFRSFPDDSQGRPGTSEREIMKEEANKQGRSATSEREIMKEAANNLYSKIKRLPRPSTQQQPPEPLKPKFIHFTSPISTACPSSSPVEPLRFRSDNQLNDLTGASKDVRPSWSRPWRSVSSFKEHGSGNTEAKTPPAVVFSRRRSETLNTPRTRMKNAGITLKSFDMGKANTPDPSQTEDPRKPAPLSLRPVTSGGSESASYKRALKGSYLYYTPG